MSGFLINQMDAVCAKLCQKQEQRRSSGYRGKWMRAKMHPCPSPHARAFVTLD